MREREREKIMPLNGLSFSGIQAGSVLSGVNMTAPHQPTRPPSPPSLPLLPPTVLLFLSLSVPPALSACSLRSPGDRPTLRSPDGGTFQCVCVCVCVCVCARACALPNHCVHVSVEAAFHHPRAGPVSPLQELGWHSLYG